MARKTVAETARETPYSPGQKQQPCGHYFPDVVRMRSVKKEGAYFHVLHCVACGEYDARLNPEATSKDLISLLDKKGIADVTPMSPEELEEFRLIERRRLTNSVPEKK